jgi:hypothetical protein
MLTDANAFGQPPLKSPNKVRLPRHSNSNGFVVFPSKLMENEWEHAQPLHFNRDEIADKLEKVLVTARSEQDVHDFFETHPQFLPDTAAYHNGPRGDLVITKMPLGRDFVTDFAFVSENSQSVQFTCIEIESPAKPLFNRGAKFSREYLDAKQQLSDWNLWAQQNMREAIRMFGRVGRWASPDYLDISLHCILVVGRRSEINTPKRQQRWAAESALRQASMFIMTYDRLIERMRSSYHSWSDKMLVCTYRDRALHVKRVCV